MKKSAGRVDEQDLTLDIATLPVTETEREVEIESKTETESEPETFPSIESAELPIIEAETEAPSDNGDTYRQDVKALELKVAELEEKFLILQAELNTLVNKKKKKKKANKEKKVKCKCQDNKVELDKCKCKSKKSAK